MDTDTNAFGEVIPEATRRLNDKLQRELGPEVMKALQDPAVVEVMLNPDGLLWEDRHGEGLKELGRMAPTRASNLLGTIASMLGTTVSADRPILEGELPLDGSRVEGVLPPVVEAPVFNIRKKALQVYRLADYERQGVLTEQQRLVIEEQILGHRNILVVGATGSGKTTFCNALLAHIAEVDPRTRMIVIEDTRELQCPVKNTVAMRVTPTVNMTMLLRATLRMRPSRIAVGEVRDKSVLDLLKAWNTGHSGGVATIHANSAAEGITRVEQLVQEGGIVPIPAVIASAINCIVSIQGTSQGRRIQEICLIKAGSEGGYEVTPV